MDAAVVWGEVFGGVFGGDAALEGEAVDLDFVLGWEIDLRAVQGVAHGDLDLSADDVDAGDHFCDGVLDLDAGIDFDEVPLLAVEVDEELDGAGVFVVGNFS